MKKYPSRAQPQNTLDELNVPKDLIDQVMALQSARDAVVNRPESKKN
jgi:hypothetical protein